MSIFVRQFRNLVRFFTPLGQSIPAPSELLDQQVLLDHDLTANGWEWLTSEWRMFETSLVGPGNIDLTADPAFHFRIFLVSVLHNGAAPRAFVLQLVTPAGTVGTFNSITVNANVATPFTNLPIVLPEGFILRMNQGALLAGETGTVTYFFLRVPVGDSFLT